MKRNFLSILLLQLLLLPTPTEAQEPAATSSVILEDTYYCGDHLTMNGIDGTATYKVLANIHTHQERTASALPSDEFLSDSDVGVSKQMGGLPVITIGHDNMVHGIIYNKQGKAEHFPFKSRNGLLNGSYRIYNWLTKTFGK